jgi:hypothetical protein
MNNFIRGNGFSQNMSTGFMAYQIGGEGKWRYSEFVTPAAHPNMREMITFKGNGYGYFYADAMEEKTRSYRVFDTLEEAKEYVRIQTICAAGRLEDKRLIHGHRLNRREY